MQTVLVINSKGGSGKTTIASNLASLFAASHLNTVLMDFDPQGSSLHWNSVRDQHGLAQIKVIDASQVKSGMTRTFQLSVPPTTDRVVIDAPAGMCQKMLSEMLAKADVIVVPVVPSPIDIHATSEFIYELKLMMNGCRRKPVAMGVVANRVRRDRSLYQPMQRFLGELQVPFITMLTDSDRYIQAVEHGMGIHEMSPQSVRSELRQWLPLVKWLASHNTVSVQSPVMARPLGAFAQR